MAGSKHRSLPMASLRSVFTILIILVLCHAVTAAHSLDRRKPRAWDIDEDTLAVDNTALEIAALREEMLAHTETLKSRRKVSYKSPSAFLNSLSNLLFARNPSGSALHPRPFDANLSNNFTNAGCPAFFSRFLSDPTFVRCAPVSLMLQTSMSFFDATKSFSTITDVLAESCAVNMRMCNELMQDYSEQLMSASACQNDYELGNAQVIQAYNGFLAYEPVYQATCLKDGTKANNYCFANAVTNASAPSDSYVYYLPLGTAMAAGAAPTCNHCLQQTMVDYADFATNSSQPISRTYGPAASMVDLYCGPTFANAHVSVTGGASTISASLGLWITAVVGAVMLLA